MTVIVDSDETNLQGKVSLVTKNALHQLHLLIFALAVMHIVYSVLTMALGRAKVMFISHMLSHYKLYM